MIRSEKREKTVSVTVLLDAVCDKCGNDITVNAHTAYQRNIAGGKVEVTFAYGSQHDMDTWEAELCDDCAEKLKDWINDGQGAGMRED